MSLTSSRKAKRIPPNRAWPVKVRRKRYLAPNLEPRVAKTGVARRAKRNDIP